MRSPAAASMRKCSSTSKLRMTSMGSPGGGMSGPGRARRVSATVAEEFIDISVGGISVHPAPPSREDSTNGSHPDTDLGPDPGRDLPRLVPRQAAQGGQA